MLLRQDQQISHSVPVVLEVRVVGELRAVSFGMVGPDVLDLVLHPGAAAEFDVVGRLARGDGDEVGQPGDQPMQVAPVLLVDEEGVP